MRSVVKYGLIAFLALSVIACGTTSKSKPSTPSGSTTSSVKPNDKCSKKGATIKINGKKYTCKAASRKDPTLRWKR